LPEPDAAPWGPNKPANRFAANVDAHATPAARFDRGSAALGRRREVLALPGTRAGIVTKASFIRLTGSGQDGV